MATDPHTARPLNGRAVLTHGRSLHALVAARVLGQHGVEVYGADDTPMMAVSFSKYATGSFLYSPASQGGQAFLDDLERELRILAPPPDTPFVLMPVHHETGLIARHRHRFEPWARVAAPDWNAIRQVGDKNSLHDTARRLGIDAPATWVPADRDELLRLLPEITFPAYIKLPDASASVGVFRLEDPDELVVAYDRMVEQFHVGPERRPQVQAAVGRDDYCLTVLFDHGRLHAHMVYRNIKMLPAEGGFGVLRETVDAPQLAPIAERLLGPLGWNGVAELDFRWDGDPGSTPYLIEVNPRFWGGLFQSVESGVDFPWLLYRLTVDGRLDEPVPKPIIGTRTRVPFATLLSELADLVHDDAAYEQSRECLKTGWDELETGRIADGLQHIVTGLAAMVDPAERLRHTRQWLRNTLDTKTEIFSTDDPFTALGALYVLGSLVRTGKLPEEFRRSGDYREHH